MNSNKNIHQMHFLSAITAIFKAWLKEIVSLTYRLSTNTPLLEGDSDTSLNIISTFKPHHDVNVM